MTCYTFLFQLLPHVKGYMNRQISLFKNALSKAPMNSDTVIFSNSMAQFDLYNKTLLSDNLK